jgi:hypothetical protein
MSVALLDGRAHAQEVKLSLTPSRNEAQAAETLPPFRVLMVVDGSSSMRNPEPGAKAPRWDGVKDAIRIDLRKLASAGVPIELTVAQFSDRPTEIAKGKGFRATFSAGQVETVSRDVIANLDQPSGETALHRSIHDALNALMADLATGRYSGGQLIIYSDGQDSAKTSIGGDFPGLFAQTQKLLAALRAKHREASVCIRPFGRDAKLVADELAKLDFEDLSKVELAPPPKVVALKLSPGAQTIGSLAAARAQAIAVRPEGLDADAIRSIEVTLIDGQRRTPAPFVDGAWRATIALDRSEAGAQIKVVASGLGVAPATAEVTAEALSLPPRPDAWGLPRCGGSWGVAAGIGQPIPLSIRVPSDKVEWSSVGEPNWSAKGATVEHPGFAKPGTYQLRATVRAPDGAASADVRVTAVDPTLVVAAPKAALTAGSPVVLRIEPSSPAIASGASARDVTWYVDGTEIGKGESVRWSASRRGRFRVEASAPLSACGNDFICRGVAWIDVSAVPSVELGDAELVRGALINRIPARIFESSRVKAIVVTLNGGTPSRITVPAGNGSGESSVEIPVPSEAIGPSNRLRVDVKPDIKTDDGRPAPDEEVKKGSTSREYAVRAPQPKVRFTSPMRGKEAAYETELVIELGLEGAPEDVAVVEAVLVDTGGGEPVKLLPGSLRTARIPRFAEHKGTLRLRATPIGRDGTPVGGPDASDAMEVTLTQTPLVLKRADGEPAIRWKTATPPTAKFTIESPGSATGWESTISGAPDWTVSPPGAARIVSAGRTELVVEVSGSTSFAVQARVRREGAPDSVLGPIDVPVVVDPVQPKFSVTHVGSDSAVRAVVGEATLRIHDQSAGPVVGKSFTLRREGMPDQAIESPESFVFAEATGRGQSASVVGTFVGMDGSTTVVTQEFIASKDHNWVLVAGAALIAVALSALALRLCTDNELLGAEYVWSGDSLGNTAPTGRLKIRWLGRGQARTSVVTKRASIRLPTFYGEDYAWLRGIGRMRIEIGGNLARPQLDHATDAIAITPQGSERNRKIEIRHVRDGNPVYLQIWPSPTADFIAWTCSLALLALIWGAFSLAFFRGYI